MTSNPKPLQAPRTVHDVGDNFHCDFDDCVNLEHNEVLSGGNDAIKISMAWNMDRKQFTNMPMYTFGEDQRECLNAAQHVGGVPTIDLQTKDTWRIIQVPYVGLYIGHRNSAMRRHLFVQLLVVSVFVN
jgi:hypothetical protein